MDKKNSNSKRTKKSPTRPVSEKPLNNLPQSIKPFTTTNSEENTIISTHQSYKLDEIEGISTPQYIITPNISPPISKLLLSNLHLVETWDTSPLMPYAVDFCESGTILVSDISDKIMVYSLTGERLTIWVAITYSSITAYPYIRDLTVDHRIDEGKIYVADWNNRYVHVLNRDGTSFNNWQTITGDGISVSPHGIVVLPSGNLIICDDHYNYLHFFQPNGAYIKTIGSQGNGPGQFFNPRQLAYDDRNGDIYVVDRSNHRIQVLDANGNFRRQWGESGQSIGQFNAPHGIALDQTNNLVFVSDTYNNRIQVFKTDGTPLKDWSANDFLEPRYMLFGNNGRLYVTSIVNKKVGIFEFRP